MLKKLFPLLIAFYIAPSQAALVFTIDNMTTEEFAFTINGTFDEDTTGFTPGVLAIRNDWTNNPGIHTDFFDGIPSLSNSTLEIDGTLIETNYASYSGSGSDSIWIANPLGSGIKFTAGTTVSGSMTLFGGYSSAFHPSQASNLELVSG